MRCCSLSAVVGVEGRQDEQRIAQRENTTHKRSRHKFLQILYLGFLAADDGAGFSLPNLVACRHKVGDLGFSDTKHLPHDRRAQVCRICASIQKMHSRICVPVRAEQSRTQPRVLRFRVSGWLREDVKLKCSPMSSYVKTRPSGTHSAVDRFQQCDVHLGRFRNGPCQHQAAKHTPSPS